MRKLLDLKKLAKHYFNKVNISLSLVILIVIIYVGFLIFGGSSNPPLPTYTKAKLSLSVYSNWDNSSLTKDLTEVNKSINIENYDQSLAANNLKDAKQAIKGINKSSSEITRRLGLVQIASGEIRATNFLSANQQKSLALIGQQLTKDIKNDQLLLNAKHKNNLKKVDSLLKQQYSSFNTYINSSALIKVIDDQQVSEVRISKIADKLPIAITAAGIHGVSTTNMYADLTTIQSDVQSSLSLSRPIEASIAQNPNNAALVNKTYKIKLATAHRDILAANYALQATVNILVTS